MGLSFKIYVDVLGSMSASQLFTLQGVYFCFSHKQLPDPKSKLSLSDISCTFLALFSITNNRSWEMYLVCFFSQ